MSFGHCRSSNQSTHGAKTDKPSQERAEVFIAGCFLLLVCKRKRITSAATTFTAIRDNGVSVWTRGLVQCLELWMLGKRILGVGKRGEDYEFQQITEKHVEKSRRCFMFFFSLRLFLPPLSLFNSVSFSPLSLTWASPLFDLVDNTWVFLLASAYIFAVHCAQSFFSKPLIHLNCKSSCFPPIRCHCRVFILTPKVSFKRKKKSICSWKWATSHLRQIHSFECPTLKINLPHLIWLFALHFSSIKINILIYICILFVPIRMMCLSYTWWRA